MATSSGETFLSVPLVGDLTLRAPVSNLALASDSMLVNAFAEKNGQHLFAVKRAGGAAYPTAVSQAANITVGVGGGNFPAQPPSPPYTYSSNTAPWLSVISTAGTGTNTTLENSGFFVAQNATAVVGFAYTVNATQPTGQTPHGNITVSTTGQFADTAGVNVSAGLPFQLCAVPSTAAPMITGQAHFGNHTSNITAPVYALANNNYLLQVIVQYTYTTGSILLPGGVTAVPIDLSVVLGDIGITPSIVSLDATWYVGSAFTNNIYSSALNQPTLWADTSGATSAGANVLIDASLGTFLTLQRHMSYILAFCQQGVQFFYDAGIAPPAAPIAPVQGGSSRVGAAVLGSFQRIQDNLYWMGCDNANNPFIGVYAGTQFQKISTAAVDRILEKWIQPATTQYCTSLTVRVSGHLFYLVTPAGAPYTLAYDVGTALWSLWTDASGQNPFPAQLSAISGQEGAVTFNTDGSASYLSQFCYQDGNATGNFTFPVILQTDPVGEDSPQTKLIAATYLLADTNPTNATIQWSDDDYQTWSTPQNVSCAVPRKQLTRGGSTIARAFRVTHQDATPFRAQAIQLNAQLAAL